jgi:hypothetical protein
MAHFSELRLHGAPSQKKPRSIMSKLKRSAVTSRALSMRAARSIATNQLGKSPSKAKVANRTDSKTHLEARIACKKIKVTMSDRMRLAFADSRKYTSTLEQAIQQRDHLREVLPKGQYHPELYRLESQVQRRQTNLVFRHPETLMAGLDGPGRPKSFYRLALEYDSSLTPKQYLEDQGRGRYLTKKQRSIVMKRLERIRASFLRSLGRSDPQSPRKVLRSFSLRLNHIENK